jgi:hypothetical protein
MTMRLSASSFAGTARTLVAVGSSSEACMFFAIALAAPRSGLTTSSSASPWDFAGLVDPAAGLVSAASAAGRALAEPLALPDVEAGCGLVADDDDDGAAGAGALPFAELPPPLLFAPDEGVLALPLVEDRGAVVPPEEAPPELDPLDDDPVDDAPLDEDPLDEDPLDEDPPVVDVDDAAAPEAPVEDEELAPAVFSPSAGT